MIHAMLITDRGLLKVGAGVEGWFFGQADVRGVYLLLATPKQPQLARRMSEQPSASARPSDERDPTVHPPAALALANLLV